MKTRIKKVIDGYTFKAEYFPQYLWLGLFWFNFTEWEEIGIHYYNETVSFYDEQDAKEYIDERRARKCSSTSYINY